MNGDEYVFYHVMRFSFKQDQNLDSDAVFYDFTFALHATAYTYHSIIKLIHIFKPQIWI